MLAAYVLRGLKAGAVAGIVFGLFVLLVASPLVAVAEQSAGHDHHETEHGGHGHGHAAGHDHAADGAHTHVGPVAVPAAALSTLTNLLGGLGWGVLLGVGFGVAFYLLEPAVPGTGDAPVYLLGAAGLVTVSGAPWLAVPPQPPGVEGAPLDVRGLWYGAALLAGAVACLASGAVYNHLTGTGRDRRVAAGVAALPLLALLALPVVAPAAGGSGPLVSAYRGVVLAVQVGLWLVLTTAFARLHRDELDRETAWSGESPAVSPGD
jgi:predicted cobalt transporter CbtA